MRKRFSNTLKFLFIVLPLFPLLFSGNFQSVVSSNSANGIIGYPCYRTLEQVYARAQSLADTFPQFAEWSSIGESWERSKLGTGYGHELRVLKITNEAIHTPKPGLVILSGIHAREFASVELALRFAEKLLQEYELNPDITWIMDQTEIHLLLISNPDGRIKAEEQAERFEPITWQKNTDPANCAAPGSQGVNLYRNFNYAWSASPSSPCLPEFPGSSAQSEPETQAIQGYLIAVLGALSQNPIRGLLINLEGPGNYLANPLFHSNTIIPEKQDFDTLVSKLAVGSELALRSTADVFNPLPLVPGTPMDFSFGSLSVPSISMSVGASFAGSYVSDCSEFEGQIVSQNLSVLLRAARSVVDPFQLGYGPEILDLMVSPPGFSFNPIRIIQGKADSSLYPLPRGYEEVRSVVLSIDTPPWQPGTTFLPASAIDGAFDESEEDFTLTLNSQQLAPGRHILFLQSEDTLGRLGLISAVIIESPEQTFLPLISSR